MAVAPLEIRIALDSGYAQYMHGSLAFDVPVGTTLTTMKPTLDEQVWQFYVWCFGSVRPMGPTPLLAFAHWQEGVQIHGDPFVHSLVDFEYPIWANCTRLNPHNLKWINSTGAIQTIDMQYHLGIFPNREKYLNWYCDLILLGLRNRISDFLLDVMGIRRTDFVKKLDARRTVDIYPSTMETLLAKLKGGV